MDSRTMEQGEPRRLGWQTASRDALLELSAKTTNVKIDKLVGKSNHKYYTSSATQFKLAWKTSR